MYLNLFYIQKSRLLLYPLLNLPANIQKPADTFIGNPRLGITLGDCALICTYDRNSEDYYHTRNSILTKHNLFSHMYRTLEHDHLVFNLSEYKKDFEKFIKGEYSKFNSTTKKEILQYYSQTKIGEFLLDMHLYPEGYHEYFADELEASISSVKEAHETLTPPNMEKEVIRLK